MADGDAADLVAVLRRRLDRERKARVEAEGIAESVTRELYVLNNIKSQFVSTVSHELRTPLAVLIGFAETLKREEVANDEKLRTDLIERISRQALRLNRLIEQILSTSLLQSPDLDLNPQPIHFDRLVDRVLGKVEAENVVIQKAFPGDLPAVVVDAELFEKVVLSLVDNAVKFSPGGGLVTIGAAAEAGSFIFWVEDQGIGMTEQEIQHAFEPFWQADPSTTRRFGGVGLGLHLVRLVARLLGGEVAVESRKGVGSKFVVSLRSGASKSAGVPGA